MINVITEDVSVECLTIALVVWIDKSNVKNLTLLILVVFLLGSNLFSRRGGIIRSLVVCIDETILT